MRTRLFAATTAAATALTLAPFAAADPAPVTGVELNQPADQVVAVEAKFNLTSDQEIAMRELRKLRGDMWDRNVPFDGTTLRQAAAEHGLTTRDAYVNAAQYDAGLSRIALQRGAEAAKFFRHERPYNSTCYGNCGDIDTATFKGKAAPGENLHSVASMDKAMQDWGYGEVDDLIRANGHFKNGNGHLHNLLDPRMRSYGFASVVTAEGEASVTSTCSIGAGNEGIEGEQNTVLHRPANGREKPSTTPKKLVFGGAGSSSSPREIISIIAAVLTVLSVLQTLFNVVQPQLQKFRHLV